LNKHIEHIKAVTCWYYSFRFRKNWIKKYLKYTNWFSWIWV